MASSSQRQFSEISIAELPEVLAVASDSLDPTSDEERWLQVLEAVDSIKNSRVSDRVSWEERLDGESKRRSQTSLIPVHCPLTTRALSHTQSPQQSRQHSRRSNRLTHARHGNHHLSTANNSHSTARRRSNWQSKSKN